MHDASTLPRQSQSVGSSSSCRSFSSAVTNKSWRHLMSLVPRVRAWKERHPLVHYTIPSCWSVQNCQNWPFLMRKKYDKQSKLRVPHFQTDPCTVHTVTAVTPRRRSQPGYISWLLGCAMQIAWSDSLDTMARLNRLLLTVRIWLKLIE